MLRAVLFTPLNSFTPPLIPFRQRGVGCGWAPGFTPIPCLSFNCNIWLTVVWRAVVCTPNSLAEHVARF
jgi:hypothetical protein